MSSSLERELIAHARVLRGLARDLVGDSDADDLVQETALQALRGSPPRVQNFGAWLAGIVRHLASRHHRGERRRQRREQHAVRDEVQPAPTGNEDREAFAQLTAAVLALPEPYQAAILQRYVRDLSPSEIAERTGTPVATVKTRLARGLALLRERLERDGLGRDWRAALGSAFGLEHALRAGVTTTGVLLMGTGTKLALGGVAAAMCAALWWWGTDRAPDAVPIAAVDPSAPVAAPASIAGSEANRTDASRSEAGAIDAAAAAVLRGRCVDAEGRPLAGCEVRVRGVPGSPERVAAWQRDHGAFAWTDAQPFATAADGVFVLHVTPTGPFAAEFAASAPGRAPATTRWSQLDAGFDLDLGEVVLRREVSVHVRVVDAGGDALPDVGLSFKIDGSVTERFERWTGVITDAAGRADLVLPEGEHGIQTSMINGSPRPIRVPGNVAEFEYELRLQGLRGVEFLGGVVLQRAGRPVANAFVSMLDTDGRGYYWTRTATDGRFVFGRPDGFPDVPQFVHCHADGLDTYIASEPVPFGERNVQIVLEPGVAAEFRVRDAETGSPVERFDLVLVRKEHRRYDRPSTSGFHRGGVVCFDPLPRGAFELTVVPRDEVLCASYFQPIQITDAASAVVEVNLARAATRTVVVRRADGGPVEGARFELLDNQQREGQAHPDRATTALTHEQWINSAGSNMALQHQEGRTDARGEATLRGAADRLFALRVTGVGSLPFVVCDVALARPEPLVLTMQEGARLRGRIGPASFLATMREATGQADTMRRREDEPAMAVELSLANGDEFTVPVAEDGSFAAAGLVAGTWSLRFCGHCRGGFTVWHALGEVVFADYGSVERSFDLTAQTPARVRGTLVVDGAPFELGEVRHEGGTTQTDSAGRFDAWTRPGSQKLFLRRQGDSESLPVAEDLMLLPGQVVERAFEVRTGLLRVQIADAQGKPFVVEVSIADERGRWRMQRTSNHEGRIEQRLEAGTFRLSTWPRSLQKESARERFAAQHPNDPEALQKQRLLLGSCTVAPGKDAWQVLVMPAAFER